MSCHCSTGYKTLLLKMDAQYYNININVNQKLN